MGRILGLSALLAFGALMLGCEPYVDSNSTGTTVVTPPATDRHIDVDVNPGAGVSVETPAAAPGDKPVDVDVGAGGAVDVDVNPDAAVERIRERREDRQEERSEEAATP